MSMNANRSSSVSWSWGPLYGAGGIPLQRAPRPVRGARRGDSMQVEARFPLFDPSSIVREWWHRFLLSGLHPPEVRQHLRVVLVRGRVDEPRIADYPVGAFSAQIEDQSSVV